MLVSAGTQYAPDGITSLFPGAYLPEADAVSKVTSLTEGVHVMKKCTMLLLALAVSVVLAFGCTGTQKETVLRCPKCGTYFRTQEGIDMFMSTTSPSTGLPTR